MSRTYAGVLGAIAFLVTSIRGLLAGSDAETTLLAASGLVFVFAAIGCITGWIADKTVEEAVRWRLLAELRDQQVARADSPTQSRSARG